MTYLIAHSGIKGQKWGQRRYRNPDGTLTPEGRRRYKQYNKSEDQKKYENDIRGPYQELSTKDIAAINARDKQVSEYKKSHSTGREKFKAFLKENKTAVTAVATAAITAAVTQAAKDLVSGAKNKARGPYNKGKARISKIFDKAADAIRRRRQSAADTIYRRRHKGFYTMKGGVSKERPFAGVRRPVAGLLGYNKKQFGHSDDPVADAADELGTYFAHYGVKGQKWGTRRYQNEDGSLTEEGKERYGVDDTYSPQAEEQKSKGKKALKVAGIVAGTAAVVGGGILAYRKLKNRNRNKGFYAVKDGGSAYDSVKRPIAGLLGNATEAAAGPNKTRRSASRAKFFMKRKPGAVDDLGSAVKFPSSAKPMKGKKLNVGDIIGNRRVGADDLGSAVKFPSSAKPMKGKKLNVGDIIGSRKGPADDLGSAAKFPTSVKPAKGKKLSIGDIFAKRDGKSAHRSKLGDFGKKWDDPGVARKLDDALWIKRPAKSSVLGGIERDIKDLQDQMVREENPRRIQDLYRQIKAKEASASSIRARQLKRSLKHSDDPVSDAADELGTYFAHHGIKGQKWGIRRYQNEDGTLTEAGKKRYGEEGSRTAKQYQKFLNDADKTYFRDRVEMERTGIASLNRAISDRTAKDKKKGLDPDKDKKLAKLYKKQEKKEKDVKDYQEIKSRIPALKKSIDDMVKSAEKQGFDVSDRRAYRYYSTAGQKAFWLLGLDPSYTGVGHEYKVKKRKKGKKPVTKNRHEPKMDDSKIVKELDLWWM